MRLFSSITLVMLAILVVSIGCGGGSGTPTEQPPPPINPWVRLEVYNKILSWTSNGCTKLTIDGKGEVASPQGSLEVDVAQITTFTISCLASDGRVLASDSIEVGGVCLGSDLTSPPCTMDELHAKIARWVPQYVLPSGLSHNYEWDYGVDNNPMYVKIVQRTKGGDYVDTYWVSAWFNSEVPLRIHSKKDLHEAMTWAIMRMENR